MPRALKIILFILCLIVFVSLLVVQIKSCIKTEDIKEVSQASLKAADLPWEVGFDFELFNGAYPVTVISINNQTEIPVRINTLIANPRSGDVTVDETYQLNIVAIESVTTVVSEATGKRINIPQGSNIRVDLSELYYNYQMSTEIIQDIRGILYFEDTKVVPNTTYSLNAESGCNFSIKTDTDILLQYNVVGENELGIPLIPVHCGNNPIFWGQSWHVLLPKDLQGTGPIIIGVPSGGSRATLTGYNYYSYPNQSPIGNVTLNGYFSIYEDQVGRYFNTNITVPVQKVNWTAYKDNVEVASYNGDEYTGENFIITDFEYANRYDITVYLSAQPQPNTLPATVINDGWVTFPNTTIVLSEDDTYTTIIEKIGGITYTKYTNGLNEFEIVNRNPYILIEYKKGIITQYRQVLANPNIGAGELYNTSTAIQQFPPNTDENYDNVEISLLYGMTTPYEIYQNAIKQNLKETIGQEYFNLGYNKALEDLGAGATNTAVSFFGALARILEINIFPNFTIGTLLTFVVGMGILTFIIKFIRG